MRWTVNKTLFPLAATSGRKIKIFGLAAISTQLIQELGCHFRFKKRARLSRYGCFEQELSKISVSLNNCLTRSVQYSDLYLVYSGCKLQRGTEEIRLHYPKTKLKPTRSAETSRCQHMPCHHSRTSTSARIISPYRNEMEFTAMQKHITATNSNMAPTTTQSKLPLNLETTYRL